MSLALDPLVANAVVIRQKFAITIAIVVQEFDGTGQLKMAAKYRKTYSLNEALERTPTHSKGV